MTSGPGVQRANYASVGAFVDELVRAGVRHFCVSPGSRSTPLAIMVTEHPRAQLTLHLDERSAGFFALGMAKLLREPVALVCTSGTAAANYLPAVVEAFHARVPLIVLTADRPHELRDTGAPQTIDQIQLYGGHAKWFADLAEPDPAPEMLRYTRAIAARAAATARSTPAGPVHINCPYREPLVPRADGAPAPWDQPDAERPLVAAASARAMAAPELVADLAAVIAGSRRGLIVCGPQDDPALATALARLSVATGYPLLADPLSGARCGPHVHDLVLSAYDAFLRDDGYGRAQAPDLVLRFGAMPVSKPLLLYMQRHAGCRTILVDAASGWLDPARLATDMLPVDGSLLCAALGEALPVGLADEPTRRSWADAWSRAERLTRAALTRHFAGVEELSEGKLFAELSDLLPDGATLYAGNSMPIRDLDTFFPTGRSRVRMLANRGVNGIDGVVSSALGAAAAGAQPLLLAIGDISLYHDSNGLLAARSLGLDATIVLINNDGGGIFSFLPQASEAEQFERLFGTPHGLDFEPLAAMYGARYTRPSTWPALCDAVRDGITGGGLHIVEVRTERQRNVALHRELWPLVSAALAEAGLTSPVQ
jgi:2-succinyl-5-enolpyruvyl-6-hydroxy-3-cyclohexene-1-carboxylate synthase